jgi:hypothetical protein
MSHPNGFAHMRALRDRIGADSSDPGTDTDQQIKRWNALPNWRQRWCTRTIKIEPAAAYLLQHAPAKFYVGLRADEEAREGGDYSAVPGVEMVSSWRALQKRVNGTQRMASAVSKKVARAFCIARYSSQRQYRQIQRRRFPAPDRLVQRRRSCFTHGVTSHSRLALCSLRATLRSFLHATIDPSKPARNSASASLSASVESISKRHGQPPADINSSSLAL